MKNTKAFQHFHQAVLQANHCDHPELVDFFAQEFELLKVKKGDFLHKQGQMEYQYFFVHEGVFRIYQTLEDGRELCKAFVSEGFIYAEHHFYWQNLPIGASAQALEDCVFLVGDFNRFYEKTKTQIEFANFYMEELKKYQIRHYRRELLLQSLPLEEYYRTILRDFGPIASRVPQYHIASYLGISEVSLSRIKKKINQSD